MGRQECPRTNVEYAALSVKYAEQVRLGNSRATATIAEMVGMAPAVMAQRIREARRRHLLTSGERGRASGALSTLGALYADPQFPGMRALQRDGLGRAMGVRKLDWAVSYSAASGKRLRNEYDTESRAKEFAARQAARASEFGWEQPSLSRLKPRRWEAGYRDHEGKWKTRRFPSKDEATEFVKDQTKSVRGGTYIDPKSAAEMTVADLHKLWIDRIKSVGASGRRPATPKTVQGYEWLYSR